MVTKIPAELVDVIYNDKRLITGRMKAKIEAEKRYNVRREKKALERREDCKNFLRDLDRIEKKYGFRIGGCGCCGSPWVEDTTNDGYVMVDHDDNWIDPWKDDE